MNAPAAKNSLDTYMQFARPYHDAKDQAHNFRHVERIAARLPYLSQGMGELRLHVLYFLTAFHGLHHLWREDAGFRNAAVEFLRSIGWDESGIAEMAERLDGGLSNPIGPEEEILYDANAVELLGAFGIAKAFTVGGARGQTYEETAEIFEHRYLDKVEFRTPNGRQLLEEGSRYARDFLNRLREEW